MKMHENATELVGHRFRDMKLLTVSVVLFFTALTCFSFLAFRTDAETSTGCVRILNRFSFSQSCTFVSIRA